MELQLKQTKVINGNIHMKQQIRILDEFLTLFRSIEKFEETWDSTLSYILMGLIMYNICDGYFRISTGITGP